MGQPAARIGDPHSCPATSNATAHEGGPVVGPCAPTVLTGGIPQARVTDQCVCHGPPDMISRGSATVIIAGRPAARMGDQTVHGGVIVGGLATVLIGDAGGGANAGVGGIGAAAPAPAPCLASAARSNAPFVRP